MLRQLMALCPIPDLLKIATLVFCIKVYKGRRFIGVDPDLAENPDVDGAHQLLADDIEAVCWAC